MKRTKKKLSKGTNVRLSDAHYAIIKKYCNDNGLIIGLFVSLASIDKIKSSK
jgi:hypothetical protein